MIYRADFKLKSSNINLISSTIFGNISRVLFEIFDEDKALSFIDLIIKSNTLISDMLLKGNFPNIKCSDVAFKGKSNNLKDKRKEFRAWKEGQNNRYDLKFEKSTRLRIRVDRQIGVAEDGYLFYEDEKWFNGEYSVYVYTENEKVLDIFEIIFKIFEKIGLGNDLSIGLGQVKFNKFNEKIFTRDIEMEKKFFAKSKLKYSISSVIVSNDVLRDYKFLRYEISRYDGRSLNLVKPPYHLFEKGAMLEVLKFNGPYLYNYKDGDRNIFIYNCVFPITIETEEGR
ncbi:hypothetical protein [Caloramator sp. Dgby_cultured_2]|uniref:hypothetical protein n=1 Tax=Caloramator sp. Dgby_cultured_2 TaxID=3029174 RepID=UPI00237D97E1|nr:hypothetical protein [Caloramator sp. Dgby_cultured_2]WDU83342.1 hypothetical protein PWK10_01040 [Caloramator sp. Dgby_cultured_2]